MPTATALHITSLDRELRGQLKTAIERARKAAETGAVRALEAMGVHLPSPPAHLDKSGRDLRNALRAHGKQAGDGRHDNGKQELTHLVQEVAYAHWHRMLFARFLAENDLLISYEYGVVIDLNNAAERAEALDMRDVWEYAAKCAQPMLPQIFPADDPVLQLALPPETVSTITDLLNALPPAVFQATDSLGWVYQFWQTERKKEVDAKANAGHKVEADDISPKTQLFTEDYMVLFLLDNTLGSWWAGKRMQEPAVRKQLEACASEADCRAAVALPDVEWSYLRWRKQDDGTWTPAAGTFDKWPRAARELKVLDPCMGSGHFLVFALPMLVALRQTEERLDTADAVSAVLRDNLFGLELDPRCTQIAAFNLALAAWKMAGHQALPALHLACSGLAPNSTREEWAAIAELASGELSSDEQARMKAGMEKLYDLFAKAPTLGSLIDPNRIAWDAFTMSPTQVLPLLERAVQLEGDIDVHERASAAQGLAKAAELLAGHYGIVVTNVPYLGRKHHSTDLMRYADETDIEGRNDLANLFINRCLRFAEPAGTVALVTPQNWLFLPRYKKHRVRLWKERTWNMVARLGAGAFETIGGHVVNVALLNISSGKAPLSSELAGVDVSGANRPPLKAALLRGEHLEEDDGMGPVESHDNGEVDVEEDDDTVQVSSANDPLGRLALVKQEDQLKNVDSILTLSPPSAIGSLSRYARAWQGIAPTDAGRFRRSFWEVSRISNGWVPLQSSTYSTTPYSGRDSILYWEDGEGQMKEICQPQGTFRGKEAWGRKGVNIAKMSELAVTLYGGEKFDSNAHTLVPFKDDDVDAIWAFCSSEVFAATVRKIDQRLDINNSTLSKVPFDLAQWKRVAAERYPTSLPEPESNDPVQWVFHGHPAEAEIGTQLQVAVARLLGYRWPTEHDKEMRLSERARQLVEKSEAMVSLADADGIVCLPAVQREQPAFKRLQALLATAYGNEWNPAKERELLGAAGHPEGSLEEWLRDSFFKEHCKLFHDRPFVWHVWDGMKDGFHALVNYHQLAAPDGGGKRTLEKLIYTYLGDWITRQEQASAAGADGAAARLAAAQKLKAELEKILAGEPPYDLFIRWKPLHQQPLGWDPDINDGVRLNIRPWLYANDVKAKSAGVLRTKPNSIKWGPKPDRGQEPKREKSDYPWFWNWDERTENFTGTGDAPDGARWNDLHYTLEAKRAARRKHETE